MSGRITVGELVAFNAYLAQLAWPMIAFGWVTNLLQRGMASWKRMLQVMDTEPAVQGRRLGLGLRLRDPKARRHHRARSSSDNLTFSFGDREVLSDMSFSVKRRRDGRHRRRHGSGKSTLVNLLPRLHNPPRGTVFIDGRDVRDIPLAELRGGHRLRAAGAVSVLGHARRQRGVRRAAGARSEHRSGFAAAGGGRAAGQGRRRLSRTATTRWWASAASRCRAARSSARPSREPSSPIRAF